jgi:hypothetical protein
LDTRLGSDVGIGLDLDKWAYERVVANGAAIEVYRFYYGDIFAEADVFDLGGMNVRSIGHDSAALICCDWKSVIGERFQIGKQCLDNRDFRLIWLCVRSDEGMDSRHAEC